MNATRIVLIEGARKNTCPLQIEKMYPIKQVDFSGFVDGEPIPLVQALWFMPTRRVCCLVWVRLGDGAILEGHGYANGWHYGQAQSALQRAMDNAGIRLFAGNDRILIHGAEERAMMSALYDIARLLHPDLRVHRIY